jgi:hypothetical protein
MKLHRCLDTHLRFDTFKMATVTMGAMKNSPFLFYPIVLKLSMNDSWDVEMYIQG